MADISNITLRRYGTQVSPYDSDKANEPIEDLHAMIQIVNAESGSNASILNDAKGDTGSLAARLDVSLNPDGSIKSDAIDNVPIDNIDFEAEGAPTDRVLPTRADLDKINGVQSEANKFTVQIGNSEIFAGNVILNPGKTVVMTPRRRSDGVIVIDIDTVFAGDRIHEHRNYQECKAFAGSGVAMIPNKDDNPIPGTMRVFLNGMMLRRQSFEEYYDPTTKKIVGARIIEKSEAIKLDVDSLWFEYSIRPMAAGQASSEKKPLAVFDYDVVADDLINLYLPLGDPSASLYKFWMIKLPDAVKAPYDLMQLFVSEDAFPHAGPSKGLTFRRYGQDWDVVTLSGIRYLRWRYDQTAPVNGPVSGNTYDFLATIGSGSTAEPNERFAPTPLSVGVRIALFY